MPETLADIFIALVRRKMRFLLAVVGVGALGIAYSHGFSWPSVIALSIAVIVLSAFWALTSFWIWVFSTGRSQQPKQEPNP